MIRNILKLTLVTLTLTLLLGCSSIYRSYNQTSQAVDTTRQNIEHSKAAFGTTKPPVVENPGYYADTTPIPLTNNPSWLQQQISVESQNLPLSFMVSQILRKTNAVVSYGPEIDAQKPVSLTYRGTIKGALEALALKTNYAYNIDANEVTWSGLETKTFNISFMPGSSDYLLGQSQGATKINSSDTDISTIKGNLDDEEFSSLRGSLSVWNDLKQTLNDLKSKDGKVFVSESTTTVTVYDHPSNVRAMSEYIQQLNSNLSKQVELQVKVLQVELDQTHKYGIDWNLVENWLGTKFSLLGNASQDLSSATVGQLAQGFTFKIGEDSSNALLQALGLQGKVRVVTEPNVLTMNNNVAEIRISRDTSYLRKSEVTVTGTESTTTTSLDPGVVTDGFNLYLLPKIQGDSIYLQITSYISNLERIDTINSQGILNQTTTNPNQTGTAIQIPTLAEKRFNIRSIVENGSTLVIAGFKQLTDKAEQTQFFGSSQLGGRSSSNENLETIILITPYLIEKNN